MGSKLSKRALYNEQLDGGDLNYSPHVRELRKFFNKDMIKKDIILSEKQTELYSLIRNSILTVVKGSAGTSKTFTSCYTALNMLADNKIEKIILTKPIQEAGENLGFLPGTLEEKIDPYIKSYKSTFEKIIPAQTYNYLVANGVIKFEPLAYMRGLSIDNSLMIIDEAQNMTLKQLMLWVTRIGKNSKGLMLGDVSQYDIRKSDVKYHVFIDNIVKDVDGASTFEFTKNDIVRNKFLIDLVDNYEKYILEHPQK